MRDEFNTRTGYNLAMAVNTEILSCISIVLCDDVYRDEETKKLVLVGVFNHIGVSEFPYTHPKMHVLFTITNAHGDYDVVVSVEDEEGDNLFEMGGPLTSNNPLHVCDINTHVFDVTFERPAKYWIVVRANGEILAQRPFRVVPSREMATGSQNDK
jgi:hypothetical protein